MIEASYTLTQLAADYPCTTGNLRQRIGRGTLKARKIGPVWVVTEAEYRRVMAERDAPKSRRAK